MGWAVFKFTYRVYGYQYLFFVLEFYVIGYVTQK